ncbi:MAG: hypothetical protein AAF550_03250 [Myxococcota bacterium]
MQSTRLKTAVLCALLQCSALCATGLHAGHRRSLPRRQAATSTVRLLGLPDLALSSTSRWLRHPSLSEPSAPFSDGPATLDQDPAGGVILAPVTLYREVAELIRPSSASFAVRDRRPERSETE